MLLKNFLISAKTEEINIIFSNCTFHQKTVYKYQTKSACEVFTVYLIHVDVDDGVGVGVGEVPAPF